MQHAWKHVERPGEAIRRWTEKKKSLDYGMHCIVKTMAIFGHLICLSFVMRCFGIVMTLVCILSLLR